jgi:prepilin-type N-terminal cleavage/methylation domain-containing protein
LLVATPAMRTHRGFTLLELIVVVGIVAMVMMMVVPSFYRARETGRVEATTRILRGKVEHVRSLAGQAGPHIGDPNAAIGWVYGPGCVSPVGGYLWVQIDNAGNYSVPTTIDYRTSPGKVIVGCETGSFTTLLTSNGPGLANPPTFTTAVGSPIVFSFSNTGRVLGPGLTPPANLFFQALSPSDQRKFGFRILPSGVLCNASIATNTTQCDSE